MFTPTIQEWSFTVERQLTRDLMLQVGYVGSQSYHTNLGDGHQFDPRPRCARTRRDAQRRRSCGKSSAPWCRKGPTYFPSTPPIVVNGVTLTQRPNPYVSNNTAWVDQGTASYHALNVSLQKRVTHGLAFKANYTWAKVIDMNSAHPGAFRRK